jgi:hypothetical protein
LIQLLQNRVMIADSEFLFDFKGHQANGECGMGSAECEERHSTSARVSLQHGGRYVAR